MSAEKFFQCESWSFLVVFCGLFMVLYGVFGAV